MGPPLLSRRRFLALSAAATAASHAAVAHTDTALTGTRSEGRGLSAAAIDAIDHVAIHPGVGVARVGSSTDAFYFGPELPRAIPPPGTQVRDPEGALARQAARFRIYGYDSAGRVIGELTSVNATIEWSVHLANRKAAWYRFGSAMDIPEATQQVLRNRGIPRADLVLDGGLRAISKGATVKVRATAMGVRLLLGELLTDSRGRLIVLPGFGVARSWTGSPVTTFANNDEWLDDVADGPVKATVRIGNKTFDATPGWILTGPPNYAPGLATGWKTMYDLLEDTWVTAGLAGAGNTVSFRRHILPLFLRLARLEWVNAGILRDFGWKSPNELADPAFLLRLADKRRSNRSFRSFWANRFRDLDSGTREPHKLPPMLGDAPSFPVTSPRQWIAPTPLQLHRLDEWAAGRFESDGITEPPVPNRLADLPLRRRPRNLDRAPLEACLAEAFHPGCEFPWATRQAVMWEAPYRLKVRSGPEPDFGSRLTPTEAVGPNGPLNGSIPGALTRWMAVPWMTDTVDCRSGYQPSVDKYLDTFWPARVPNQVLTQADYGIVMDRSLALAKRKAAFRRRKSWLRTMVTTDRQATLNRMVRRWDELGVVVTRPGPAGGAFPDTFAVEVSRRLPEPPAGAVEPTPELLPADEA
jgi:hypothetical protein